jgi:hypothetical protein
MNAWQWPYPSDARTESRAPLGGLHLEALGWRVVEQRKQTGLWQDVDGDFLGLVKVEGPLGLPRLCDEDAVRRHCALLAAGMESELIEAAVLAHVEGRAVQLVCRRLENARLVIAGILMVPAAGASWVWSMEAKERGGAGDGRRLFDGKTCDCRLPGRPLSKVRRELRKLLAVRLDG